MGLDRVFVLVTDPTQPVAGLEDAATLAGLCRRPSRELLLEAHRALCDLNEHNRHLFLDVIEQLEAASEPEPGSRSLSAGSGPF